MSRAALRTLPEQVRWPGSLAVRLADLATHDTPWLAVVDGGRHYDPMADLLTAAGVPVLRSMDRAVRLVDRYAQHAWQDHSHLGVGAVCCAVCRPHVPRST